MYIQFKKGIKLEMRFKERKENASKRAKGQVIESRTRASSRGVAWRSKCVVGCPRGVRLSNKGCEKGTNEEKIRDTYSGLSK